MRGRPGGGVAPRRSALRCWRGIGLYASAGCRPEESEWGWDRAGPSRKALQRAGWKTGRAGLLMEINEDVRIGLRGVNKRWAGTSKINVNGGRDRAGATRSGRVRLPHPG